MVLVLGNRDECAVRLMETNVATAVECYQITDAMFIYAVKTLRVDNMYEDLNGIVFTVTHSGVPLDMEIVENKSIKTLTN